MPPKRRVQTQSQKTVAKSRRLPTQITDPQESEDTDNQQSQLSNEVIQQINKAVTDPSSAMEWSNKSTQQSGKHSKTRTAQLVERQIHRYPYSLCQRSGQDNQCKQGLKLKDNKEASTSKNNFISVALP